MFIELRHLEEMYPFVRFDKNALQYSWQNLAHDQLIMIEASIRRNFFHNADKMCFFFQLPYQLLKKGPYRDKDIWLVLIEGLSLADQHDLEEELSLPFIQDVTEWCIHNKIDKIYDLLRFFDDDRSRKIFKNDKLSKITLNCIVNNNYKIVKNEFEKYVTDFINDVNTAKKYAPDAVKILNRSDWSYIFRHVIEKSTDSLPGKIKNKPKESELKQLSEFLKAIEKLEHSLNNMHKAYVMTVDAICEHTREKMRGVFIKIKKKFDKNYYDDHYLFLFCALTQAVMQNGMERELPSVHAYIAGDPFRMFKLQQYCEFVLSSKMTRCFKKHYEATLKLLADGDQA